MFLRIPFDLENLPLGSIEWTSFCFLHDLSYNILLDASIFTTIDDRKEGKMNSSSIF